jgi:hypothetical protein
MKTLSPDTHPEIERILIEGYRRMTPREKMQRVLELNRFGYQLALTGVRRRHPNADEREQNLRVASRYLPPDLMRKVFDWDPEKEGY